MNHFQIQFRASSWRKWGVSVMAACLILCVMWFHFGTMRWILLLAIVVSTLWAWRESPKFIQHIDVQDDCVYLHIQNHRIKAKLRSGSLISHHVCFLHWQSEKSEIWQCILPDMLPENDFRRLRAWARWCQYR